MVIHQRDVGRKQAQTHPNQSNDASHLKKDGQTEEVATKNFTAKRRFTPNLHLADALVA